MVCLKLSDLSDFFKIYDAWLDAIGKKICYYYSQDEIQQTQKVDLIADNT